MNYICVNMFPYKERGKKNCYSTSKADISSHCTKTIFKYRDSQGVRKE